MSLPKPLLEPTVYIGTFIHCTSLTEVEILEDSAIGVDEHGIISFVHKAIKGEVEDNDSRLQNKIKSQGWTHHNLCHTRELGISFFFPGFIDTHIHACQLPNAGIFGKTTLLSWLYKYTFPLESSLSDPHKAELVYSRCIRQTLQHGTTCAAYFATSSVASTTILAQQCLSQGQRAFVGRCNMDTNLQPEWYRDSNAAAAIENTQASIQQITELDPTRALVSPIITPRFAPSCTAELLRGLGKEAAATHLPIQTHLSENHDEIVLVKKMFPESKSYADVYDVHGLLGARTVLAHACHLSQDEISLVSDRKSGISHCPASNSYLGSGMCPVRELLDAGINVGLGTDVSGGYSPSILVAAREAGGVSRLRTVVAPKEMIQADKERLKLGVEETLYLATRGGAKCLGLQQRVGGFEVGMEWDAQLVDLGYQIKVGMREEGGRGNVEVYEGMGWEERLAKWVFCGDDRNTRAVWVKGRLVSGSV